MNDSFVEYEQVLETHNPGDIAFLKSILDASGIIYFIQGEYAAPFVYYAVPMRLLVKKDQAAEVRDILKDIELSFSYGGSKDPKELNEDE